MHVLRGRGREGGRVVQREIKEEKEVARNGEVERSGEGNGGGGREG